MYWCSRSCITFVVCQLLLRVIVRSLPNHFWRTTRAFVYIYIYINFECIRFSSVCWILTSQKVLYMFCLHPWPTSCGSWRAHCLIRKTELCAQLVCTWCHDWSLRTVIYCDDLSLTSSFTPCSGLIEDPLRPAIKLIARQHVPNRFISTQDNLPVLANPEPHHRAVALCQLSRSSVEVARLLAQPVHVEGTPQHGHPWWTWCNAYMRSEFLIVLWTCGLV